MQDWVLDAQADVAMCRDQAAGASYYVKKSGSDLSLTIEVHRQGGALSRLTILPFGHFGVAVETALMWRSEMMGVERISVDDADLRISRGKVRKPEAQNVIRLGNWMTPKFACGLIVRAFTAADLGRDVTAAAKRYSDRYRDEKVDTGIASGYRLQRNIFGDDRDGAIPKVQPVSSVAAAPERPQKPKAEKAVVPPQPIAETPKPTFRAQPPIPIYEVVHERAAIGVIYKLEVRTAEKEGPRQEAKVSLLSRFLSGRNT
ncbi:hypothetical protein [Microvirga sp. VF16]|uniref:hypothetical protein n=1 Tax=Microvirga sp. VF16 TaxID=2807101 RepID=UPI00193CB01A|nr:hypothetical protein [Microvirga sp. VF16]QRM35041.1 hypothetical protein JO965_39255 [Microvirga sp. VF16]